MQLFPIVADNSLGGPHAQLTHSFDWATIARRFRHPSASTAYDHAMSLFQATVTFAPTLDKQHSRLVARRSNLQTIPLQYASYLIDTGYLEQAIETLERGRGLLWSEMRGLRTSIDQIRLADSYLAAKFSAVNRELETLALTFSLNNNVDGNNDLEGMDPYGHSVVLKQKLLDDRENIIMQIRALPGFDAFLKPPPFDTLRSAASHGPVIIIGHCEWRSDILILLHSSPPSLICTSDDFYTRANKLQDQLLEARRMSFLDSEEYDDALRVVLKELYELVGRPVIRRLNELNIPEQSRVWWCPTSVFCSLPLHAMGPIPSDVGPPRYFLDLYIPSYTPSLSALLESRKPNPQTFKNPSVLLVVQPDISMMWALDEMKAVQRASSRAMTLFGASATTYAVLDRLRDHRFAHIVCHGLLEPGKPFNSSFKFHRGERLSLHDIVQSQLPNAEFAFLSACHTAKVTDESPVDEALHLTAAMQYCGFRSVVGTMWYMADVDGRDLAESFYKSVFSGREQGVPYHERTAEALRDAVVRLRRRRGRGMTLERWVNYVHYGA
jgi:CHAT domain-containing protein